MTWVKLDDTFYDNPTNRALGPAGRDLFIAGLAYCAKGLTDGVIPKDDLALVLAQAQAKRTIVAKLVKAGRWIDRGDHYEVDQYLTYQPSKAKVLADRERDAAKKRRQRGAANRGDEGRYVPQGTAGGDTPQGLPEVRPSVPDPTRPLEVLPPAAASPLPADWRQQLVIEACRAVAEERATLRGDVGQGWIVATARGLATDHHQALHRHLTEHPAATVTELVDVIDGVAKPPARPEPVNPSSRLRPVHEVVAPPLTPEEREAARAAVAHRPRLFARTPEGDDAA